jgi:hypothetical protein
MRGQRLLLLSVEEELIGRIFLDDRAKPLVISSVQPQNVLYWDWSYGDDMQPSDGCSWWAVL